MKVNQRRLLLAFQWAILGLLSASAVVNSATDHGILMAINCFCLGVVFFSMLCQKMIARTLRDVDEARDGFLAAQEVVRLAADDLQHALRTGQIEVVQMQPFDFGQSKPTQH